MSAEADLVFLPGERPRPRWLRAHRHAPAAAVATVCFGAFMGQFDTSVVALTYHRIGTELDASLARVQWISLSYLITLGVLLVPVGAISDRLGRKRLYLWGFALFGGAAFACAFAPNLPALDGLRAAQGLGAAMLQANSVALVTTSVPAGRLRSALGVQAAAQAVGLAIGPTVGGLFVQTIGWRWVFAAHLPIALLGLIAGRYLLPRTRVPVPRPPAALRTALRTPHLAPRLGGAALAYLLLFAPIVLVPAVLQADGVSPLGAGLTVAALPLGFALAASSGRLLPARWGGTVHCRAGLVLIAAGSLALGAAALPEATHLVAVLPGLVLLGAGAGLFNPANNALVMGTVPSHAAGSASGLVNTARTAGTAAGTAMVAAIVDRGGGLLTATGALLAGCALCAALSWRGSPAARPQEPSLLSHP